MSGWRVGLLAGSLLCLAPAPALAGMPAPLPTDPDQVLRLNEPVRFRLQAISFFLAGLLLCALAVRLLWNYLASDFPRLPRLSFGKALAGVLLWGLLFVVVLTMISGARELMTPGAWEKQGFTYKLKQPSAPAEPSPLALRRQQLERLKGALWHFAATHKGRFPSAGEMGQVPADLWNVPDSGGLRYLYVPGLSADSSPTPLAWEPELDPEQRLVLRTSGEIVSLRSSDIHPKRERRP
jgi:hypothetical protein